jgi:uncharacterized protein (DUF1800 family)
MPSASVLTDRSAGAREQTADQQVHHVLSRLAFGARPGDVEAVRAMGVDTWIARQLQPERLPAAPAVTDGRGASIMTMRAAELLAEYPPPAVLIRQLGRDGTVSAADSVELRRRARDGQAIVTALATHRIAQAARSERQLEEVLVDFWYNHFNVFVGKDRVRYFLPEYDRETIRPHAMGSFRALLGAVAKSPAMLYYLDNWQSVADSGRPVLRPVPPRMAAQRAQAVRRAARQDGAVAMAQVEALLQRRRGVNENYARELMELHTLGVDGGFTQQDVMEVARALTGWTLENGAQGGRFLFRPQQHDAGAKVILGKAFPAGGGQEEGEAVLDLLARHPATATFIATKLARRFVSDTPPAALVQRAAGVFLSSNGDIRETVRTIVTSSEFFSTDAYRAKVKSPFELVVSTLRALGVPADGVGGAAQMVARLGQPIHGHQAPNGWPETGEAWMNTGAILNRINFGLAVATNRLPGVRLQQWPAARTLATQPREAQVDGVIRELLGDAVSSDTRAVLLTGTNPLLTSRGDAPRAGNGFAQIVGLALGSPEFQRR